VDFWPVDNETTKTVDEQRRPSRTLARTIRGSGLPARKYPQYLPAEAAGAAGVTANADVDQAQSP